MNAPALNLLRYPRNPGWARSPLLGWAAGGLLAGLLCGLGWGLWCQSRLAFWQQEQQALQARLAQQTRAQAEAAARAQAARRLADAQQRRNAWRSQREQWLRLQDLWAPAAAEPGLRLQRWQGDEQRLQLQGSLPQGQALPELQARLAGAGPWVWSLQSLSGQAGVGGTGLQFTLEAPATAAPHSGKRP